MICKNIQETTAGGLWSFLRSYRLTGRLTVFFILVKPFADVVWAATSTMTKKTNSSMICMEYTSLLAVISRGQHSNYIMIII